MKDIEHWVRLTQIDMHGVAWTSNGRICRGLFESIQSHVAAINTTCETLWPLSWRQAGHATLSRGLCWQS